MEDLKKQVEEILKSSSVKENDNQEKEVKKLPKYDPGKKYRWEPGSKFNLSGEEFGVILNSLRTILTSPEAQRILLAERASQMVDNVLARAVASGVVQEDNSIPQKAK